MTNRTTPGFPLADFLGMVIEQAEKGSAVARVEVTAGHLNPHGSVHGAVLFTMVDTAMGPRP
jgi:acyl-CoA thioesterase